MFLEVSPPLPAASPGGDSAEDVGRAALQLWWHTWTNDGVLADELVRNHYIRRIAF